MQLIRKEYCLGLIILGNQGGKMTHDDVLRTHVFSFSGGRLCLDFANTVDWRDADEPGDRLIGYPALASWGWQASLLREDDARRLIDEAARRPDDAAATFARAIALREAIYRIFSAVAAARAPAAADLDQLNAALPEALAHARVEAAAGGFTWGWRADAGALDPMLWPVARSAAELLTSDELDRVRECADDDCGWLFMDMSRNRSRRWCSMQACGNRAKARRFYARKQAAAQ